MIKLAIVSPCYNEEEVLEESTTRLTALLWYLGESNHKEKHLHENKLMMR